MPQADLLPGTLDVLILKAVSPGARHRSALAMNTALRAQEARWASWLACGRGGDVHYLSLCPSCIVSRIALADVSGHGLA